MSSSDDTSSNSQGFTERAKSAVGLGSSSNNPDNSNTSSNDTDDSNNSSNDTGNSNDAANTFDKSKEEDTSNDSSNQSGDDQKRINDDETSHTPWHAAPGDASEREHGKDSSASVKPTQGSARAPEFLADLGSGEATQAGSADRPTQPKGGNLEGAGPANV